MSDRTSDSPAPTEPRAEARAPAPIESRYWLWLAMASLAVLGIVGYVDLKIELSALARSATVPEGHADTGSPGPAEAAPDAPPPTGDQDPWSCEGTIAEAEVLEAVGRHGLSVFECYEERRREDPELAGTLLMHLKVSAAGGVEQARFVGPFRDPELLACVRGALARWQFPSPAGGSCAIVEAPFSLRPDTP
jgi:hypothetical protein